MNKSGVAFGTSGARGAAAVMTNAVCYAFTSSFLQYMVSLVEFSPARQVALADDLLPSTPVILAACSNATKNQGGVPLFFGYITSRALALHASSLKIPLLMVTGSHIPEKNSQ